MKKYFLKKFFGGFIFSLGIFGGIILLVKAAGLTATTGSPLTATNWNSMVSNFFWGSGSLGIYYNGNIGIGTTNATSQSRVYINGGTQQLPAQITSSNSDFILMNIGNSSLTQAQGGSWAIGVVGNAPSVLSSYFSGGFIVHQHGVGPRMIVSPQGNVGIGVARPTEKLEVNGNIKAYNVGSAAFGNVGISAVCSTDNGTTKYSSACPSGYKIVSAYMTSFDNYNGTVTNIIGACNMDTTNNRISLTLNCINNNGGGIGCGGICVKN